MKDLQIPVALVEAWVFIETYDQLDFSQEKQRAQSAIKEHFGSIEMAKNYIEQCRNSEMQLITA